jgi:hypothetical protein
VWKCVRRDPTQIENYRLTQWFGLGQDHETTVATPVKRHIYIYTRIIFCTKNIHHCEPYICNIKISKKIGLPENRLPRIPWFIIISNRKIAIRGYTVYWYTTFSGTPKSCSVGYILISPWYLRKNSEKTSIVVVGYTYIYIYVYISICGFLQYLLIQIQWSWLGIQPNWFYIMVGYIYIYLYNPTIFRQKFPAIH